MDHMQDKFRNLGRHEEVCCLKQTETEPHKGALSNESAAFCAPDTLKERERGCGAWREAEHAAIIYSLNCEPFCTPFPLPLLPSLLIIQSAGILDGERESAIMAKTILIWVPCMRTFNFSACMPTSLLYLSGGSWTDDKEIR